MVALRTRREKASTGTIPGRDAEIYKVPRPGYSPVHPRATTVEGVLAKQGSTGTTKEDRLKDRTRVLIVHDHRLFAEAIMWSLEKLGMAASQVGRREREAVAGARAVDPDLILIDLAAREEEGLALGKRLRRACPRTRLLALNGSHGSRWMDRMVAAGFSGCLGRDASVLQLVEALHEALEGRIVKPDQLPGHRERTRPQDEWETLLLSAELTPRERETLPRLLRGEAVEQAAAALGVSPNTVRNHTRSIFRKLGVHTRLEAAALAARHGFPVHPRARSTGR